MTHGSLFSGIGGFDLAAEWMGWENKFHCEWNEFGQKVLHHYWPNAEQFSDIKKSNFTKYANRIDILTGGFPCQPYSSAGKRLGKEDDRHLWPEMLRAVKEIQPRWIVGENVYGLVNWSGGLVFHEVQADLEAKGYEVFPYLLPAVSVNAPHRRDRIWFVAHSNNSRTNIGLRSQPEWSESNGYGGFAQSEFGKDDGNEYASNTNGIGLWGQSNGIGESGFIGKNSKRSDWSNFPTVSPICNGDDGIPDRLDSITFPKWRNESIKAGGNAVCPQVVLQIFKAIEQYERISASNKSS